MSWAITCADEASTRTTRGWNTRNLIDSRRDPDRQPRFLLRSSSGRLAVLLAGLTLAAGLVPATADAKKTVKFRLVIEGNVGAIRNFSVSGEAGLCTEELENGSFTQQTEFLRGKGVILEVTRRKVKGAFVYGIKRVGHSKAEFTVVAKSTRDAQGTETFKLTPLGEQLATVNPTITCPEVPPDLSKTAGCGVVKTGHYDVGLELTGNNFSVGSSHEELAAPLPKPTCGESTATTGLLKLEYEFPEFAPVGAKPLPDAKMFGRANAIAVELEGKVVGKPKPLGTPPLTGWTSDGGVSQVTVRFIRCGERKQPAC